MADSKKYDGSQWEHSLRKLTTATADIEPTIYTDGTAITTYSIKGNTTQSGTPTPSNPITISGVGNKTANLFNKQAVTNNERVVYTDGTTAPLTGVDVSDYIPLETGETYTLNISSSIVSKTGHLYAMYDSSKNFVNTGQHPSTGAIIYSFTVPNGVSFIRFNSLMTELDNVMLVKGSYTTQTFPSYEPYGYKIPISSAQGTTNIYLNEPLYKIGDYADTINSDGTVTRRIGKVVLDGTENQWIIYENPVAPPALPYALYQLYTNNSLSLGGIQYTSCYSNIAPYGFTSQTRQDSDLGVYLVTSGNEVAFQMEGAKSSFPDVEAWRAYLSQNPVTVYYIKATPTTEQIMLPSIPTTDGANSITVDTTVQPSEFTATWTGWHDSSVKEYDGTDWQ